MWPSNWREVFGSVAYVFKWTDDEVGRLKLKRLLWWNDRAQWALEEVAKHGG